MPILRQPTYRPQPIPWERDDQPLAIPTANGSSSGLTHEELTSAIEQSRREGYETGYRDGFLAGQQEGYRMGVAAMERQHEQERQQWRQQVEQLVAALGDSLRGEIAHLMARMEDLLTELALEIARKVVEVEVTSNPEIVRHAVTKALQELRGGTIIVRLHPHDFALLESSLPLLDLRDEGLSVRFVADESVERGGVLAESEQGVVDLQPSTKFALLRAEVL
jgi:flagellar assembly protein FliH